MVDSYSSFRKLIQGPNKRHTSPFILNLLSLLFDNSLPPYTVIIGESGFFCGTAHTIDLAYSFSVVLTRSSIFCIPCKLISLIRFGLNLLGKNTSSVVQLYGIVCGTECLVVHLVVLRLTQAVRVLTHLSLLGFKLS